MNVRHTPIRQLLQRFTLLGLLPLAVATAVSGFTAYRAHRAEVQRATADLARAIATAVETELSSTQWALQALAASNEVQRADFAALHGELTRFAQARQDVQGISLANRQGMVILRTNAPADAAPVSALEPESLATTFASGKPSVGGISKGRTGAFAYPVRVPVVLVGATNYVLTAAFRPDRIQQLLERQKVPADWVISVFDDRLRRVARSRLHETTIGGAPAESLRKLLESTTAAEGTGISHALEGDEIITAFTRVPSANWVVAVGSPASVVSAFSGLTLSLYALGVGGSLLLALLVAGMLSSRIRSDIQKVVERAAAIGNAPPVASDRYEIKEVAVLADRLADADRRVREALDEAKRSAAVKDQFLAVLGHELRNPLHPIVNVLNILERKCDESTSRERQILRRQVVHMTRLVDDLLDVSRLVRGELSVREEWTTLDAILRESIETFRQREPSARLQLHNQAGEVRLLADPIRIGQVMANLLTNAHRHGSGRQIDVTLSTDASHAEVRVTDDGEGMTAETLAQVFEPFYRGSLNGGSLGLGLHLVKGIVERHGGSVEALSAGPGRGTSVIFRLRLPQSA